MTTLPPQSDYWRIYHNSDVLRRSDALRQSHTLLSTGVRLNIDVYEQSDRHAPVIVFNHGGGGYSRLFIPIALALYDLGYTVVLPDQRGQGLSEGVRGDMTIAQLDRTSWTRFSGRASAARGRLSWQAQALAAVWRTTRRRRVRLWRP